MNIGRGVLWDSSADNADYERAIPVARYCIGRASGLHHKTHRSRSRSIAVAKSVLPEEEERAREIIGRHSDKDWSLCDAISFAVLDRRRIRRAFTFDRHFLQYGRIEVLGLPL